MKKTYIEPKTECITLKVEKLLGSLSGDGLNVSVSNDGATGEAESRQGRGFFDE